MFRNYRIRDYDFKLVILLAAVSALGVLAVGSAREAYQTKQIIGASAGMALLILVSLFDYSLILKTYWLIYAGNLLLLGLVALMGEKVNGARRWLNIGSFQFQPSETAKILLILFFAQFIMKYREKLNTFKMIAFCVVLVLVPWTLIYKQPDLSTSVVLLVAFCIIMFAGGISYKLVVGVLAVAIPAAAILVFLAVTPDSGFDVLEDFQKNRILAFLHPEEYSSAEAYQQLNSVTAIASGQLDGKGYQNSEVTSVVNGNFISEPQTDFIFAVIGEEFGFKGSVFVISCLMLISLECISIARKAKDLAGTIIAAGMGGLIAFQSFVNIGVTTFILPNTGLTLPFVSAGLSSQFSLFFGMGFVLNVRLQARKQ
ncbi:MAG: rod shape-determining protein RodA [Clostridium sp.]|jgi:rod shape determining protein RodA|nr:rod shape-determining protein RodA [Clostridium sp.]